MSTDTRRVTGSLTEGVAEIKKVAAEVQALADSGLKEVRESLELAKVFVQDHVEAGRELRAFMAPKTNHGPTDAALEATMQVRQDSLGDALAKVQAGFEGERK